MSDLYRHIMFACTAAQGENIRTLGRFLVMNEPGIASRLSFSGRPATWPPAADTPRLPPLAFGMAAGIGLLAGEAWADYLARAYGIGAGSPAEYWVEGQGWDATDPAPASAALRLMYILDYGTPGNWREIMTGSAKSDYGDNGFLWDRLGLVPSDAWMRKAGWKR